MAGQKGRPIEERFWEKVDKSGDCWMWTASVIGRYGNFGIGRGTVRSHRLAWQLTNGPIPPGMRVLHRCDVTLCVRPSHLFLGTQADNVADMDRKGRRRTLSGDTHPARRPGVRVGERNGRARLTVADVLTIRRLRTEGVIVRVIAERLGVSRAAVQHVVDGRNWAHIK